MAYISFHDFLKTKSLECMSSITKLEFSSGIWATDHKNIDVGLSDTAFLEHLHFLFVFLEPVNFITSSCILRIAERH